MKNTPFTSNNEKDIKIQKYIERKENFERKQQKMSSSQRPPDPMVNLQVYQPSKPPMGGKPKQKYPAMYEAVQTQNPYMPAPYTPYTTTWPHAPKTPWSYTPNKIPVFYDYTIDVSGPLVDHNKVSTIYNNYLDKSFFKGTFQSIRQRIDLRRNIIGTISNGISNGDNIGLSGKDEHSLLSYVKFMDLNPYRDEINPYKEMPQDFLIYRSGYPINYDRDTNRVICAKNSVGINIRLYRLSNEEDNYSKYAFHKKDGNIVQKGRNEFDIWNEVDYYNYINKLIQSKICPNFVQMYAWYKCNNSLIDYENVNSAGSKFIDTTTKPVYYREGGEEKESYVSRLDKFIAGDIINPIADSGKSLIILTESPTYNIKQWATDMYTKTGVVESMIKSGFHTEDEWLSVLFQMFVGLHVLQNKGIAFNNFTLNNVLIKDLKKRGTTYWKYIINGVEYYVPNLGYLTLIDSTYGKDAVGKKIISNIFKDGMYDESKIKEYCCKSLTVCSDHTNYTDTSDTKDKIQLPDNVSKILAKIKEDVETCDTCTCIADIILRNMTCFLNNRIGTYMTESESKTILEDDSGSLKKGEMIAYAIGGGRYTYAMYSHSTEDNSHTIYTRTEPSYIHENNIIHKNVNSGDISKISQYDTINQKIPPHGITFDIDSLEEIYVIN